MILCTLILLGVSATAPIGVGALLHAKHQDMSVNGKAVSHYPHEDGVSFDGCWQNCEGTPGYCGWCRDRNACCKKDWNGDPSKCQTVVEFVVRGADYSSMSDWTCVEVPPEAESGVVDIDDKLIVWISGYPRSGSSILLSMVAAANGGDNRAGGRTFSLFEPCHEGDSYDASIPKDHGCWTMLYNVAHCDFRGIQKLWGWDNLHTSNNYTTNFDQVTATRMCQEAEIIAWKTVDKGHRLRDWKWLLDTRRNMKILDLVRDPRAIYASWKTLQPFKGLIEANDFYTLGDVCDHFAHNIDFDDPRVHRVIFEDLMRWPTSATQLIHQFLGKQFQSVQERWVRKTFAVDGCVENKRLNGSFADCHNFTGKDPRQDEKWRYILSADELSYFANSESCQRVAKWYNYALK